MQIWADIYSLLQPRFPLLKNVPHFDTVVLTTFLQNMFVYNKITWNKTKKVIIIIKKIQLGLQQDTHNLYKANKYIFISYLFFIH